MVSKANKKNDYTRPIKIPKGRVQLETKYIRIKCTKCKGTKFYIEVVPEKELDILMFRTIAIYCCKCGKRYMIFGVID